MSEQARQLASLREICKISGDTFSEELLEYEEKTRYVNPWHISVIYDVLDNILTQDPVSGKIIFNSDPERRINRKIAIECPRNHAKSTAVSVNWTTKETYRDQNLRIVIASNVLSQASSFLREVKSHLERGEELIKVMGSIVPKYPEKWTDTQIIVVRTTKKKDPTISTTGTGGAVLSKRADVLIFDDLLNPDNTRTPEARVKVRFWVDNVAKPVLEPNTGRLIVIGTVWYNDDYLDESMKDPTFDVRLQLRALIKDSKTGEGSDHEYAMDIRDVFADDVIEQYGINAKEGVLWPERWPMSELLREKESMGSVAFNRQYLNVVISEETQIIKTEWLTKAKRAGMLDTFLAKYDVATCPYGPLRIVTGWDLAISQSVRADWTVGVTLGRQSDSRIRVVNITRGRFTPAETRKAIGNDYVNFKPVKVIVENVAYQESLRRDMADYTDIPIEGYTTGGEKFDEDIGVNSVGVLFENEKIILPYNFEKDPEMKELIDRLVSECESFGLDNHTGDILMALWFAIIGLRSLETAQEIVTTVSSKGFYTGRRSGIVNDESAE